MGDTWGDVLGPAHGTGHVAVSENVQRWESMGQLRYFG